MIEVSLKQDNDSMVLASLTRNGSDIVIALTELWGLTLGQFLPKIGPTIGMFPSDIRETAMLDGVSVMEEIWHLWPELGSYSTTELPGRGLDYIDYIGWTIGNWVRYGGW